MPLHVYDDAKILQDMRPDNRFTLGRPKDNITGNRFSAEIKQAETIRQFLDALIG